MAEDRHDDDRQGMEPEAEAFSGDEAGDPVAAFEALRETVQDLAGDLTREMTTIRKGVEGAFDRMERQDAPVDYSAELGRMTRQLAVVARHLQAVEKSPVLRQGAEHYARVLERSGEALVRTAVQTLERQTSDLDHAGRQLAAWTKSAHDRKDQDWRMWMAGGAGLFAGVLLLLLLPRFLPFSADSHVASLVMGQDRWKAGIAMMRAGNPKAATDLADASILYRDNAEVIDTCRKDAQQDQKDQKCTIVIQTTEK